MVHNGWVLSNEESSGDPGSAPGVVQRTGLYVGFEAYRTPTDSDYQALLTKGLVVPDTNVFLNLYRYNEQTRSDLFAVMRSLADRLWVPQWVMVEFWRNRETVLQDPRNTASTVKELNGYRDKAISTLQGWANRVGLAQERTAELTQEIEDSFGDVADGVIQLADDEAVEFVRNTNKDPVLAELERLLHGRVGDPLAEDDYQKALAEARLRADERRPPGYKDLGKSADSSAGDYLVWLQVLMEARSRHCDVLMVTGDVKEDWWRREYGELRGPRPELVQEMKKFANVRLFMLRPESLLVQARQILRIRVHDESLQDVERVDRVLDYKAIKGIDQGRYPRADGPRHKPPNLAELQVDWGDILNDVLEAAGRRAWTLLRKATPADLQRTNLELRFERESNAKEFRTFEYTERLEDVLRQRYDFEFSIVMTSDSE